MRRSDPPALVGLSEGLGPLAEPLFLLHCGAVFDGERDDWDTEANSGAAVDALADRHPGETLGLYALTPADVGAVNAARKERADRISAAATALNTAATATRWSSGLVASEEMMEPYEMDDVDRALVAKVREAIAYEDNGDPAKDVIDDDEMIDAMRLLLQIIDAGCAA